MHQNSASLLTRCVQWVACCCILAGVGSMPVARSSELKALFVTGFDPHGHKWEQTTPILEGLLNGSGKFDVEIIRLTSTNEAQAFAPDFAKYSVVVLYAHGLDWSKATQCEFEKYMNNGGGLVVIHNAVGQFGKWDAYRAMIGIGPGNQDYGTRLRFDEDKQSVVQVPPGEGVKHNGHGSQHEWVVKVRDTEHPITAGLPKAWMHSMDELYHGFRGKPEDIKDVKVLATAFSSKETGGTGEHEPVMIVNQFGKGRVFHTMLGHSKVSISCAGFQTVFLRGTEWAATGKVTLTKVPADFPTETKASIRPASDQSSNPKIVFIGGLHTHGPGAHENARNATLLKSLIDTSVNSKGVATALYLDKLPDNLAELDDASAIVIMWEGWGEHFLNHTNVAVMNKFGQLMQRGVGLMCLHAATAVEDGVEPLFMKWTGGNKKQGYSTHRMEKNVQVSVAASEHPVCRGVGPMQFAGEEFYQRILFDESAGKITPVLTVGHRDEKPADNVVAWAFERAGGGRSFCCTGPHYCDSLKNENFCRLILNAVLWVANRDVPQGGVQSYGKESSK